MEIIRGLYNLQDHHLDNVLTIGNFDGIHLGHQAIIKRLKIEAKRLNVPMTIMTFEPHPQEYFAKNHKPLRLTSFREKMELLANAGVDRVVCVRFNQQFSSITAEKFIEEIIIKKLQTRFLVIGDDFRFGQNRHGDFKLLQKYGETFNFSVQNMPTLELNQERVSSTRIRSALQNFQIEQANKLLGHAYHVTGRVSHGDKRGRAIGFPTANIFLKQQIAPPNGVYVVKILGLDKEYFGVANIGQRPTVDGKKYLLEAHLFEFDQNIYQKQICVNFLHFIRPEKKFANIEELTSQISEDCKSAQHYLNR